MREAIYFEFSSPIEAETAINQILNKRFDQDSHYAEVENTSQDDGRHNPRVVRVDLNNTISEDIDAIACESGAVRVTQNDQQLWPTDGP